MRIEIAMLTPRQLGLNSSRFIHWGTKAKIKTAWQQAVFYAALQFRGAHLSRAHMRITCVIRDKRSIMDTDNLLSILKSAIDVLKPAVETIGHPELGKMRLDIIADDKPGVLTIHTPVEWIIDRKRYPLTVIDLEEVPFE